MIARPEYVKLSPSVEGDTHGLMEEDNSIQEVVIVGMEEGVGRKKDKAGGGGHAWAVGTKLEGLAEDGKCARPGIRGWRERGDRSIKGEGRSWR